MGGSFHSKMLAHQRVRSLRAEEPVSPEQTDVEDKVEEVLSKTHGELWRKWGAMGLYHHKAGRARTFYSIPLGLSENVGNTPKPNGEWSISLQNGYNWGNTLFSDTPLCFSWNKYQKRALLIWRLFQYSSISRHESWVAVASESFGHTLFYFVGHTELTKHADICSIWNLSISVAGGLAVPCEWRARELHRALFDRGLGGPWSTWMYMEDVCWRLGMFFFWESLSKRFGFNMWRHCEDHLVDNL